MEAIQPVELIEHACLTEIVVSISRIAEVVFGQMEVCMFVVVKKDKNEPVLFNTKLALVLVKMLKYTIGVTT
ncbi:hypothetical protein P4V41_20675 [Fictibacillus nanhaiensis]|uniref:hypothetical protein n=1 Tax=Fictibacillus nanhaiensis TaxID=742169 RepID=UPI002E1F35BA|nr:hypothetical protein [Fictibacillus nanhaiensis]